MARGINTINGVDYVYEYKSQWNAKRHRSEQKRDYIGKIKDGKFVPNKLYMMRLELETLKRQKGLPSDSAEMPLEDEIELIYQKHEAHKAKLAEMKNDPKPRKTARTSTARSKETMAPEPEAVEKEVPVEETPAVVPEHVVEKTSEIAIEETAAPVEVAGEETPVVEEPVAAETPIEEEASGEVLGYETPVAEPEVEEKPKKHILREGELDDEEYGPDLFKVQPSVAPVEEEPEVEVTVEEEDEEEDPDLFAFSDDIETMVSDEEESSAEVELHEESVPEEKPAEEPEAEPVAEEDKPEAIVEIAEPVAEEVVEEAPLREEPRKKAKAAKTRKEKKEEDNGQLFLF